MSDFMEEKTPEESLGAYLKRVRENRGFSLEDFSKKTRVSLEHLREIEAGEWNKFPVEAYVRGYLNSISVVLRLDMPKILEYYSKESGSSYSKEFVAPASFASETEPFAGGKVGSNKAGTKVFIVVLLVLAAAIFVGMNFLKKMEGESVPSPVTPQAIEAEEDTSSFETDVPDGAENIPPESLNVALPESVAVEDSSAKALVKSNSATTFVSSSDSKKEVKDSVETEVGKIQFSVTGNDSVISWVGLYRSLNDNKVLREANITSSRSTLRYAYNDTLCVVIGNPDAVGQMVVNGKSMKVPVRKGYASRFCIAPNGKITRR
ncbi:MULTISPECIES: helix-turn-helix domain-containing protein [Fibrobacter]|uniref:Protein RodZ, contains Xre-like HTH and DUF4115 domains n=1 Tax=Fibrobacter intestinalis TaxID=28122 RepID=A0A1T4Q0A8_9BACT|nr:MULTISPECIES: helix-turn-helix domain-containing protein [Fibrobacter]PBC72762.1 cytoskeletal protein RodZ [Fibrobacter sp. NR9]SJZ96941.1 protein RodZ, contains Xre-like HTH and DUF4115 domains [Fibrobacter intestinalis]